MRTWYAMKWFIILQILNNVQFLRYDTKWNDAQEQRRTATAVQSEWSIRNVVYSNDFA